MEGHKLTLRDYEVSGGLPREELYGIVSQLRRCSASTAVSKGIEPVCKLSAISQSIKLKADC